MSPFRQPPRSCCFTDALSHVGPVDRHYAGMHTVRVEDIVGSVGRCRELDENFHYVKRRHDARYDSVRNAVEKGVELPAVELYGLGGLYFVVDGHHRVAVAKENKQVFIDAEVVEYVPIEDVGPGCMPYHPTRTNPLAALTGSVRALTEKLVQPVRQQAEQGTLCPYHTLGSDGESWCEYAAEAETAARADEA